MNAVGDVIANSAVPPSQCNYDVIYLKTNGYSDFGHFLYACLYACVYIYIYVYMNLSVHR